MSTIPIPSNTLRDAKRLFGRLKHLRCKLPVLRHLLLTADANGVRLAATDLDHWLETRICEDEDGREPLRFLIPPEAMDAASRADKGTQVAFTPCGGKRSREVRLKLQSGGIETHSVFPTLDPKDFPERPETMGDVTVVPPATLQGLADIAGCASTDATRQILNGVLFTPEDGGRLVATDGRRLACCPAAVPTQSFILPIAACHILGHPDFTTDLASITWIDHKEEEKRRVAIKCRRHHLVSKPLVGNYPNYKQVIPAYADQLAVIPHDRKPGLIAWLRSLGKDQASVRLDWHKRGQLTLTHRDANGHSAAMQVPVEIHGNPPVIAFNARFLADALEIGSTLCFSDELSPGICRHPTGRFCVIMPMRVTIPAGSTREVEAAPMNHAKAAA
jgi:DNA polymerase III sliding clamp (beta) subunit (PCNA family)